MSELMNEKVRITVEVEMENKEHPELVVCAACKVIDTEDNGKIYLLVGARHYDYIMNKQAAIFEKLSKSPLLDEEQGFITNFGRFVSRKEALEIAKANNQIRFDNGCGTDELYSEMLY